MQKLERVEEKSLTEGTEGISRGHGGTDLSVASLLYADLPSPTSPCPPVSSVYSVRLFLAELERSLAEFEASVRTLERWIAMCHSGLPPQKSLRSSMYRSISLLFAVLLLVGCLVTTQT